MFETVVHLGWFADFCSTAFGTVSIVLNLLLIYLVKVRSDTFLLFATFYRWLIVVFAITDIFYSLVDMGTGMGFLVHGHCMFAFLSKRLIWKNAEMEQVFLIIRCSTIPVCFGILQIHFFYRYIIVCKPWLQYIFTKKKYIALIAAFFIFHGVYWYLGTLLCFVDPFSVEYMNQTFVDVYNVHADDLIAVMLHFEESRPDLNQRAWFVLFMASFLFSGTLTGFLFFGVKTYKKLKTVQMSMKVRAVHLQLLKILIIQTLIPVVVAMLPCSLIWLSAAFGSESPAWHNLYMVPLMSSFPFLDPLVNILLFPNFRISLMAQCVKMVEKTALVSFVSRSSNP